MKTTLQILILAITINASAQKLTPLWKKQSQPDGNPCNSVSFSNSGDKILSGSECDDARVRMWDKATGNMLWEYIDSTLMCYMGTSFSSNGNYFAVMEETGKYAIFDNTGATPMLMYKFDTQVGGAFSLAFSPDNTKIITGGTNNEVRVYNAADHTLIYTLTGHTSDVISVGYSPNGMYMASGDASGKVKIWNAATGALISTYTAHSDAVNSLKFTSNNTHILTAGADGMSHLASISSNSVVKMYMDMMHMGEIKQVDVSNDLSFVIAAYADGTTIIYNYNSGNVLSTIASSTLGSINSVSISSDNNHFAVATGNGSVVLYSRTNFLSVENLDLINQISIYPNPTKDYLYLSNINDINSIRIFDAIGKEVKNINTKLNSNKIDVSDLENGVYKIVISNGASNSSQTFVKQ